MSDPPLADETAVRLRQAGIHPDDPALTEVAATNREAQAREQRRLGIVKSAGIKTQRNSHPRLSPAETPSFAGAKQEPGPP